MRDNEGFIDTMRMIFKNSAIFGFSIVFINIAFGISKRFPYMIPFFITAALSLFMILTIKYHVKRKLSGK